MRKWFDGKEDAPWHPEVNLLLTSSHSGASHLDQRAWTAIEAIRERHAEATVVVVSHNFVILTLLCRVLGLPLANFRRLRHDLAAVSVLELTRERQAILALNDRCHLRAEESNES